MSPKALPRRKQTDCLSLKAGQPKKRALDGGAVKRPAKRQNGLPDKKTTLQMMELPWT